MSLLFLAAETGLLDQVKATGETFGFNGWLFLSQACSFAIVCLLLYKFAYGPILAVLEKRRQTIEQGLEDARRSKEALAESAIRVETIITEANAKAALMIEEARAAAETIKARDTKRAQVEAEQIVAKAHETALLEHQKMLADLKKEVARLVVDTTGRVTGKVLTPEDHRRLNEEAAREVAA